jgi:pSer/pThr/pTyr-binding forkhead associated (FHA) protein
MPATAVPVSAAFPAAPPGRTGGPAPVTEPVGQQARPAAPRADATTPRWLVITSGPREGLEIDLPSEQLTIGRSSESGLVIRDDYTSTHHARLMLWNDQWVIQDLDSTNGTFLAGSRVMLPTPVPPGTPVTIGTTSFELRR